MTVDQPAQGLIPPRPNLGPEPWSEPVGRSPIALPGLLAISAIVGLVLWRRRRKRVVPAVDRLVEVATDRESLSNRARWVALSDLVRSTLIAVHGPGWGSKTTEELADDPDLAGRWGGEQSDRLIALLRIADRAKFAVDEPEPVEDWEAWAQSMVPVEPLVTNAKSSGKSNGPSL